VHGGGGTPGEQDFWFPADEKIRTDPAQIPAPVGPGTLVIQKDNGTFWRAIRAEDKSVIWRQIDKDPFMNFYPDRSTDPKIPVLIKAWDRVIDDGMFIPDENDPLKGMGRTYQLPDLQPGECFEIIDVTQQFAQHPVTLTKDDKDHWGFLLGKEIDGQAVDPRDSSIVLDVIGEGSVWRFAVVGGDIVAVIVPTISGE
jgi:hypothetical protein